MSTKLKYVTFAAVAFLVAAQPPSSGQEYTKKDIEEDERLLGNAKVPTDGKALFDFLHRQVPTAQDEKEVEALYRRLDSNSFKERQQASIELIALGPKIVPVLKRLIQPGPPLEVRRRAEACMLAVQKHSSPAVTAAAVRLLQFRNPAGACAALLEFAPFAADELVADEVLDTLATIGLVNKKVEPALETALRDAHATRRQLAALLVGRFGSPEQRKAVAVLLDDKDTSVRFRAAQGLIGAGAREALPVLVDCLRQAPDALAEQAEDMLRQIAGVTAPKIRFASDAPAREKCQEVWKIWLKQHQTKIDLTKVDIGLPSGNPNLRAREVVRQMIDLGLKPDTEKLDRLTEIPFYMGGQGIITTRKEWDEHMKKQQNQKLPDGIKLKITPGKVLTLAEYLENAKPAEKDFLQKYPRAQVRVVLASLEIEFNGQNKVVASLGVFVRVRGARARIFGTVPETRPGQ